MSAGSRPDRAARGEAPDWFGRPFFDRALDAIGQAVIMMDRHGVVRYWNPFAEALYGYEAGAALGRPISELIMVDRNACAAFTQPNQYAGDWVVRDKAGRVFTVFVTSTAIVGDDGEVVGTVGIFDDVSERRSAETRSRELAAVINGSDDAILQCDLDGVVRHANPAAGVLHGCAPAALIGRHIAVLLSPEPQNHAMIGNLISALRGGESLGVQLVEGRRQDGSRYHLSIRFSPVRDDVGAIVGVSGIGRDVTAEVRTRARLELSERRFRDRFDRLPIPQAIVSMDGRLASVNDALCAMLGRDRAELEGADLLNCQCSHCTGPVDLRLAAVLRGERDSDTWERVLPRADGTATPALIHAALLREADGTPSGVTAFVQDMTDLHTAEHALTRQDALFGALARRASDWSCVLEPSGIPRYVSPSVAAAFGYDPADFLPLAWKLIHPEDQPMLRRLLDGIVGTPNRSEIVQFRAKAADGAWRWVEETWTNCLDDPAIAGVVRNGRDVTERVAAARALRSSEARYRAIADTAQEGIWAGDASGHTQYANQKLADILGVPLPAVYDRPVPDLVDPDGTGGAAERLRHRQERGPEEYDFPYRHPDGSSRTLRISVSPLSDGNGAAGSLAMISDVTDARRIEEELRQRALRDELTGLANRALLTDRFELALARRHRLASGAVSLIFVDLDEFKLINDSWGHDLGDRLLTRVAHRLSAAARSDDTVARFGGDKFVVICENASERAAGELAHRLAGAFTAPFDVSGQLVYMTASMGVATSPPHPAPELLRFAEAAMYEAKARGRGRIEIFDLALADEATDRLNLSNDLRDALRQGDLRLCYQPIVDLRDGQVLGVEALARWSHPTRGPLPPATFVAIAEETGLIRALDSWALTRACRDAERISESMALPPRVAVNISVRHLADLDLEATVLAAMRDTALANGGLVLEITETAVMDNSEQARELLRRLNAHGVEAAMDDFGTGYSSLAHLSRVPATTLKIDRSFVKDLTVDPDALAVTGSIIKLAQTMRLRVIAEGIETPQQLRLLRELGCGAGQGFLFSPALDPDALVDLVNRLPGRRFRVGAPDPAGAADQPVAAPRGTEYV